MWRTGFGKDPRNDRHTCTDGRSILENLTDEQRVSVEQPRVPRRAEAPCWTARTLALALISTLPRGGLSPCPKFKEENGSPRQRVEDTTSLGAFETLRRQEGLHIGVHDETRTHAGAMPNGLARLN